MHVAVYVPFAVSVLLGLAAPHLARRLPPHTATRLLVGSSLLAAASTAVAVAVLASTLLGQLPVVATAGHWSAGQLRSATPVPRAVAVLAVAAVGAGLLSGIRVLTLRLRAVLAARALCLRVGGRPGQLVVLDEEIDAVAIAAGGGRILASRGHLAALPVVDRRALLAHEGAHLRHHHHRYRLAAELAAAVDPLQHSVSGAVRYATERWADEVAAATVGSRAVVARSLARSALRPVPDVPPAAWEPLALRSGGARSVARVQAMLAPAPRRRPTLVLAAAALVACALAAAVHAQQDTETFFDHAAVTTAARVPNGSAAPGSSRAGSAQLGGDQRHEGQVRLVLREHTEGPLVGEQRQ